MGADVTAGMSGQGDVGSFSGDAVTGVEGNLMSTHLSDEVVLTRARHPTEDCARVSQWCIKFCSRADTKGGSWCGADVGDMCDSS